MNCLCILAGMAVFLLVLAVVSIIHGSVRAVVSAHAFHDRVDAGDFVDGHHPNQDRGGGLKDHKEEHAVHASAPGQVAFGSSHANGDSKIGKFVPIHRQEDHDDEAGGEETSTNAENDLRGFEVLDPVPALAQKEVDHRNDVTDASGADGDEHEDTAPDHHTSGTASRTKPGAQNWDLVEATNLGG